METVKKYFGSRIKEIRESRGLNQEQLAEIVNMESRHISRIETGKSFTTLENIDKIAKALNVDINTLFAFQHKKDKNILKTEIYKYLDNASDEQIKLAYRLIQVVFN